MNKLIYNSINYKIEDISKKKLIKNKDFINKKVIYSALFGCYDSVKPFNKLEGFDYFLFTDILINNTNWTILEIPNFIKKFNISITKKQRFIKLHPHLFFEKYDLSIYIDTSYIILGDINAFLIRFLKPSFNIYVMEHPVRNCIYSEVKAVIKYHKENKNISLSVGELYKKFNYPQKNGLSDNSLIIRRHNKKDCIYLMEKWWEQIKNYSKRDQLSFNYIVWKTATKIKYISKIFVLEYFHQSSHLSKKPLFCHQQNFKQK
jgi:hypothetical protein